MDTKQIYIARSSIMINTMLSNSKLPIRFRKMNLYNLRNIRMNSVCHRCKTQAAICNAMSASLLSIGASIIFRMQSSCKPEIEYLVLINQTIRATFLQQGVSHPLSQGQAAIGDLIILEEGTIQEQTFLEEEASELIKIYLIIMDDTDLKEKLEHLNLF